MMMLPSLETDLNYSLLTEEQRGDYEIAIKHFRKMGQSIMSAPKHILENKDCVIAAVKNSPWILKSLDKKWWADKDVVLAALEKNELVSCIEPSLMSDPQVVAKVFLNRNREKWPRKLMLNDEVIKEIGFLSNQEYSDYLISEISKEISPENLKKKHPYIYAEIIKTMNETSIVSYIYIFMSASFKKNEEICNAMLENPIINNLVGENIINYMLENGYPALRSNKELLLKYSIRDTNFAMWGLMDKNLLKDTDFLLKMLDKYVQIPEVGTFDSSGVKVEVSKSIDALMENELFEKAFILLVENLWGKNEYQYKPSFLREVFDGDNKKYVHVGEILPGNFHILLEKYIGELLMKDDIMKLNTKMVAHHKFKKF